MKKNSLGIRLKNVSEDLTKKAIREKFESQGFTVSKVKIWLDPAKKIRLACIHFPEFDDTTKALERKTISINEREYECSACCRAVDSGIPSSEAPSSLVESPNSECPPTESSRASSNCPMSTVESSEIVHQSLLPETMSNSINHPPINSSDVPKIRDSPFIGIRTSNLNAQEFAYGQKNPSTGNDSGEVAKVIKQKKMDSEKEEHAKLGEPNSEVLEEENKPKEERWLIRKASCKSYNKSKYHQKQIIEKGLEDKVKDKLAVPRDDPENNRNVQNDKENNEGQADETTDKNKNKSDDEANNVRGQEIENNGSRENSQDREAMIDRGCEVGISSPSYEKVVMSNGNGMKKRETNEKNAKIIKNGPNADFIELATGSPQEDSTNLTAIRSKDDDDTVRRLKSQQ